MLVWFETVLFLFCSWEKKIWHHVVCSSCVSFLVNSCEAALEQTACVFIIDNQSVGYTITRAVCPINGYFLLMLFYFKPMS